MQPATRQQRRKAARRLMELGRSALARGFPDGYDDDTVIGVALVVHAKLKEAGNDARAGEAALLAEQVLERSMAALAADKAIACRRGCAHCCTTVVSVTPPEVFRITRWLRSERSHMPDVSGEAIAARCTAKIGSSLVEMFQSKTACPLLLDDACSVHLVRPLNCRQLLSTSLPACIARFRDDQGEVPIVPKAIDHSALARILLLAAVRAVGLADTSYELAGALRVAMTETDAERRWLAGEDVFAGVLVTARPQSTQDYIDRCAQIISNTAG